MGRRVLVTGASGFLGHAVCALLQEYGAEVHAAYRSRPPPPDTLAHHAVLPDDAAHLFDRAQPEVVLHLASPVHLGSDPALYDGLRRGILDATVAVAAACLQRGVRLVHVGTCAEYGAHAPPIGEDAVLWPASPYAALKAAASQWVLGLTRTTDLQATVVRPFRAYGPHDRSSVMAQAFRAALSGAALPLSDGAQVREWNDADAIAYGILCAAVHPEARGQVLNLGGGPRLSVRAVVEAIFAVAEADPALLRFGALPRRPDDAPAFFGDHARATALWGPLPHPDLDRSLHDTLLWYRDEAPD